MSDKHRFESWFHYSPWLLEFGQDSYIGFLSFPWNSEALPLHQGFCLCSLVGLLRGWLLLIFQIANHIFSPRRGWFWPCSLGNRFRHAGVRTEIWLGNNLGIITMKGWGKLDWPEREAELWCSHTVALACLMVISEASMAPQNCLVLRQGG